MNWIIFIIEEVIIFIPYSQIELMLGVEYHWVQWWFVRVYSNAHGGVNSVKLKVLDMFREVGLFISLNSQRSTCWEVLNMAY